MTEFKAGDKVRILKTNWTGRVGKVVSLDGYMWPIKVEIAGGERSFLLASELELVKPRFKVGDWAKAVNFGSAGGSFEGRVGQVSEVWNELNGDTKTATLAYPKVEGKWDTGTFAVEYLVPAEAPKPDHKFAVGDWVEITGWGGGYEGQTLQVTALPEPGNIYYRLAGHAGFSEKYLKAAEDPALSCAVVKGYTDTKAVHTFAKGGLTTKAVDVVNDPAHYGGKDNPYEVIKVAEAWGLHDDAYLFNALKYLGRAGKKGDKVEDLKKLSYYVARKITLEEAKK